MPRGWSMLVLLGIVVLLFAAPKLPQLARSLGQALRIFKAEVQEMKKDPNDSDGIQPQATLPSMKKSKGVQEGTITPDVSE